MKSGYQGKDAMRANAERVFGKDMKLSEKPAVKSLSAVNNMKPKPYKKGGHVKKYNEGGVAAQALPQDPSKKGMGFKKGGKAKKYNEGGPISGPGNLISGALGDQANPMKKLIGPGPIPNLGGYKKGGKAKKMAMGGVGKIRHGQSTKAGKPKSCK